MSHPFRRYLLSLLGSLLGVFLLAWLYMALMPMAFMESGYAAWAAKAHMLRSCELGEIAFFGDSRLESGVVPAGLPVPASNFGLAAGTPVEARVAVDDALACPNPPRQAVLSFIPEHFGPLSKFFWILSVRYGFLSPGDVLATERLAAAVGDRTTLATPTPDGLGGKVRDWLYAVRFPSFSFGSLVQGRLFGRWSSNHARYETLLRSRGWADYTGGEAGLDDTVGFDPTKLQTAEFEAAIGRLRARGVDVLLLVMPFAQSHSRSAEEMAAFHTYLAGISARFPGTRLVSDAVPVWPDRMFADGAHLNAEGAHAFTARLAACMSTGRLEPPCDLQWREGPTAGGSSTVLEVQQQRDRQH